MASARRSAQHNFGTEKVRGFGSQNHALRRKFQWAENRSGKRYLFSQSGRVQLTALFRSSLGLSNRTKFVSCDIPGAKSSRPRTRHHRSKTARTKKEEHSLGTSTCKGLQHRRCDLHQMRWKHENHRSHRRSHSDSKNPGTYGPGDDATTNASSPWTTKARTSFRR
jgi:hypothetical protein